MADLATLRQEIADAINTLPDIRAWPYIPDTPQPPLVIVEPDVVDWSQGAYQRGAEPWTFFVRALLSLAGGNVAAQKTRDEFFGGIRDIKAAIEANVPSTFVSSARKFDAWTYAEIDYLGVEIVVEVIA